MKCCLTRSSLPHVFYFHFTLLDTLVQAGQRLNIFQGLRPGLTDCEKERPPFTCHFLVDISPCLISHRAALCFRPVKTPHPDGVCVCVVRGDKLTVSTTPVAKPLRKAAL